jgi:predicted nucleotidyltransferase
MKTVGIIAEYNPFHKGHAYQIQKARELSGADYVIAVMSPDFVQRGSVALADKWTRTRMALLGGADLVLELPVCYACASAEYFAEGGVAILNALNVIDGLSFGCEAGNLELLSGAAHFFALPREEEPALYKAFLQNRLKMGHSFPQARMEAYLDFRSTEESGAGSCAPDESCRDTARLAAQLSQPNNILAVEYLKAIERLHSPLRPVPVRRIGEGYHGKAAVCGSDTPDSDAHASAASYFAGSESSSSFVSAATIRRLIRDGHTDKLQGLLPDSSCSLLQKASEHDALLFDDALGQMLQLRLVELGCQERYGSPPLTDYLDVTPDLANRIRNCLDEYKSFDQFVTLIKTRQMTEARVRRALLHILLDIRTSDAAHVRTERPVLYARILGFRKSAQPLIRKIRKAASVPVISDLPAALRLPAFHVPSEALDTEDRADAAARRAMLLQTVYSSRIRSLAVQNQTGRLPVSEYRRQPVIL